MITGSLIALIGVLIGWLLGRVQRRPRALALRGDPPTICGCEHHLSMHDPKTHECHGQVHVGYDGESHLYEQCTCRQYVGPEPLPTYTAGEISS